jgi:hypothetical protein
MKQVWLAEDNYWAERITDPAALLRGGTTSVLFGKPLEVKATWPEGLPDGMTEETLMAAADGMDAERGKLTMPEPAGNPA